MRKSQFIFIFLACFVSSTFANGQVKTASWDVELSEVLKKDAFKPIGNTVFSFLFWDLYKSELFTISKQYPLQSKDDKLLYEIEYFKAISSQDLVEKTIEQWQHLGFSASRYDVYLNELLRIWPDINPGDKLVFMMNNHTSAFYYNGRLVGVIEDEKFGSLFLDIWLSENTSEPELRKELLGRKSNG